MPFGDNVLHDLDRAIDGAADAARQANHLAAPVADAGDAVQRAGDAGAVVVVEIANAIDDLVDLDMADLALVQNTAALLPTASSSALSRIYARRSGRAGGG